MTGNLLDNRYPFPYTSTVRNIKGGQVHININLYMIDVFLQQKTWIIFHLSNFSSIPKNSSNILFIPKGEK